MSFAWSQEVVTENARPYTSGIFYAFAITRSELPQQLGNVRIACSSRMSRGGCHGLTNADCLISPPAAQILPGLLRERERMAKIKETERVRIPSVPAFFFVSRMTRDASACEKHFPPVISGESGRRPPPRRFEPRGRTSPYTQRAKALGDGHETCVITSLNSLCVRLPVGTWSVARKQLIRSVACHVPCM